MSLRGGTTWITAAFGNDRSGSYVLRGIGKVRQLPHGSERFEV